MQIGSNMKTVQTVCGICSASCGMQLHLLDNRLAGVAGNKEHPGSQGYLCPKGKALVEMINSPERIRFPLKKTEQQGWQRISWSEALQLITEKISILKKESGPQGLAVHIGQAGIDKQFKPYAELFARRYGTPNFSTVCSHCHLSRTMASQYTFGFHPWPDFANSHCMVLWGANPAVSNPPSLRAIKTALKNGGQLIVVDPRSTQLTAQAAIHLQVRPGSDDALALAFLKVIIEAGLYDKAFVKSWTIGMEPLKELIRSCSLAELSGITGVAVEQIEAAARLYASSTPACIAVGNAVELHQNGFQAARAIAVLQALTGNLDIKGGERFIPELLEPLAIPVGSAIPAIGQEEYPLFSQSSGHAQANKYAEAILRAQPYQIRNMIIAGSNPLLTWPDTKQVRAALSQLDFLVVMEHFMTETAQLADLVLPAASFLGSYEIWEAIDDEGRLVVGLAAPVLDEGECRSNWWFWQALASEMGYAATYPWANEAQALDMRLKNRGLSLKMLSQYPNGFVYRQWEGRQYLQKGFATPSGKVELYSQPIGAAGYPPVPQYMQASSSMNLEATDYPFILSSGARTYGYMHSRFHNLASLKKLNPEPLLEINPLQAGKLGIEAGDMVKLQSKRGDLKIRVKYNPRLKEDVLLMPHGWDEANANLLSANVDLDPVTGYPADRSIMVRVSKC